MLVRYYVFLGFYLVIRELEIEVFGISRNCERQEVM